MNEDNKLREATYEMVHGKDGFNDLKDYYGDNRYYQTYDIGAEPMKAFVIPHSPKAGLIVNAFANYRLSHPLVKWYYKIKESELLKWRINIKLYKGE